MNERVRMQYLEALGITMYVPRFVLPQAKASAQAPLPSEDEPKPLAASLPVQPTPAPVTLAPTNISSLVHSLKQEAKAVVPVQQVSKSAKGGEPVEVSAPPSRDVRFALNIWQVGSDLLVVDSHSRRQALPTQSLLVNMLFAVGRVGQVRAPELLIWPLLTQLQEAPLVHARDMVSAFLAGRSQSAPVAALWLMGEEAHLACINSDESFSDALWQVRPMDHLSAHALILPSLADLLQNPSMKASAWRALKNFCGLVQ